MKVASPFIGYYIPQKWNILYHPLREVHHENFHLPDFWWRWMSPLCHPWSPKMILSWGQKIAKAKHSVYDLNWWGAMLRSLQGEGRSDNARFTGLQTTRPPAGYYSAACTSHICGLWVLLLSQLYWLWVLVFKDVYSLTTVQFRCSRVDSQTLEGKSPLHWMADLPHHPFSAVTLIKSALRCLLLLFILIIIIQIHT